MKKFLTIFLVVVLLCCSSCNTDATNDTDISTNDSKKETFPSDTSETTDESTEMIPLESIQLPLPQESAEFFFLSGAGGWRSEMVLNRDGTFIGSYLDSEMGIMGEAYPKGSAYVCNFSGKFKNIEQLNEYSYKMTLTDVKTENKVGEEWIEDGIRYIASEPAGLTDPLNQTECTEFIFYLPDTPIDQVPEDFLFWWPYRYTQNTDPKTTLSCYGILNVTTNDGYFYCE